MPIWMVEPCIVLCRIGGRWVAATRIPLRWIRGIIRFRYAFSVGINNLQYVNLQRIDAFPWDPLQQPINMKN